MNKQNTTGLGLAVMLAAFVLGIISILGLIPALSDKAVFLHAPALMLSLFFAGCGVALLKMPSTLTKSQPHNDDEETP